MIRLKNMKAMFFMIFLLVSGFISFSEAQPRETAFADGEKLTYVVSYKAALIPNTEVAEVVFKTSRARVEGVPTYRIYANAKTFAFFKWFFTLDDTYETWLDVETLRPVKFANDIRENKYRYYSSYQYDWDKMVVNTTYRKLRWPADRYKTMPLSPVSFDALALFYNLRSTDASTFQPGVGRTLEMVLDDTIRRIEYKFLGRETRKIAGLGTFRTLKFSCQLATSSGESFEDGSEFFLWISDDENKIPLYIESPIRVGSIRGKLERYEGLKYKLSSKIN